MELIKNIWICPYTLTEILNKKKREGVLLKILFSSGKMGYSAIGPLLKFGEGFVSDYTYFLRKKMFTSYLKIDQIPGLFNAEFSKKKYFEEYSILLKNKTKQKQISILSLSFYGAWLDAQARSQSKNLFFGYPLIENHYLITDLFSFSKDFLHDIPFKIVKVKIKSFKESEKLRTLIQTSSKKLKWRLDFNYHFSFSQWKIWEKENLFLAPFIDFIEDPFPDFFSVKSPFSFALDWGKSHYCPIRVMKPTRHPPRFVYQQLAGGNFQRVIFTHTLGHPLEARLSWILASDFYKVHPQKREICGLDYPLDFFEKNDFSCFDKSSDFYSPSGTGLGFDEVLKNRKWKKWV